jgi:hypothetical protein
MLVLGRMIWIVQTVVLSQCNSDNLGSNRSVLEIMNISPTPNISHKIGQRCH